MQSPKYRLFDYIMVINTDDVHVSECFYLQHPMTVELITTRQSIGIHGVFCIEEGECSIVMLSDFVCLPLCVSISL